MALSTARKIIFVVVSVLVLIGTLFAVYVFYNPPVNTPQAYGVFGSLPQSSSALPQRLIIESIHVDAPIINVGLTVAGAVDAPKSPHEVAWYQLGPRPGAKGSSVITGHFGPWQTGASSVFDHLTNIKIGDQVQVKDDKGTVLTFAVTGTRTYKANESAPEVFTSAGGAHLNLITCHGSWLAGQKTYNERFVVFTDLVE